MERYTQTELRPGNCWQTCIACLLETSPASLPPQVEIEDAPHGVLNGWGSYHNALNGYLEKHHDLFYHEFYYWQIEAFRYDLDYHCLIGPTVRTQAAREAGLKYSNHCVIGFNGAVCWDPHPSRAGLLRIDSYGVLLPLTERFKSERNLRRDDPLYDLVFRKCICPACHLDEFRELRRRFHEKNPELCGLDNGVVGA